MHEELIERIRQRAANPPTRTDQADISPTEISRPATAGEVAAAEATLGHLLPTVLRDLYLRVGNGGYGPGYGLMGVPPRGYPDDQGRSIVELYELYRQGDPDEANWEWPAALVPICYWGCAIYSCVDCTSPEGSVILWDPNVWEAGEAPREAMRPESSSVAQWLADWVAGIDLWRVMFPPSTETA